MAVVVGNGAWLVGVLVAVGLRCASIGRNIRTIVVRRCAPGRSRSGIDVVVRNAAGLSLSGRVRVAPGIDAHEMGRPRVVGVHVFVDGAPLAETVGVECWTLNAGVPELLQMRRHERRRFSTQAANLRWIGR